MRITFECEVDVQGDERIQAVSLSMLRDGSEDWRQSLLFCFGNRSQLPREGKHLRISNNYCKVIAVGERGGFNVDYLKAVVKAAKGDE